MINFFKKAGFFLSFIAFLWFFVPFLVAGICNIGNITGMVLAVAFMLYIKCMSLIHKWLKKIAQNKVGKILLFFVGIIMAVIVMLAAVESVCMVKAASKTPKENATAVVLGCRVYGERPSLSLVERLEAAYDYLEEYPDAVCVVAGGKGDSEDISEAEAMYRWLTQKGIDASRIYKEENSTNTDENIRFSKEIIEENGLEEHITIITSEYHTYRAGRIAEKYGLTYGAAPGKTAFWLFPTFYVRELYAILAEWVFRL